MYAKIINDQIEKYPYSFDELRKDYPQVSFPDITQIDSSLLPDLSEFGYVYINPTPHPQILDNQEVVEEMPIYDNDKWIQTWSVRQKSGITVLYGESAQLTNIKNDAEKLLLDSDYLDLPNTANKISNISEIIAYRDELRKIAVDPRLDSVFPDKPIVIWNL